MVTVDSSRDYYGDLQVEPTADLAEIKKSFRLLALKYHPDRNPGKEAEFNAKFQDIQSAHEVLSDPTLRTQYDNERRKQGLANRRRNPVPGWNPNMAYTDFEPPPKAPPRATPARPAARPSMASRYKDAYMRGRDSKKDDRPIPPGMKEDIEARQRTYRQYEAEQRERRRAEQAQAQAQAQASSQAPPGAGTPNYHPPNSPYNQYSGQYGSMPNINRPQSGGPRPASGQNSPYHSGDDRSHSAYAHMHARPAPGNPPDLPKRPGQQQFPHPTARKDPLQNLRNESYGLGVEFERNPSPYSKSTGERTYFSSESLKKPNSPHDPYPDAHIPKPSNLHNEASAGESSAEEANIPRTAPPPPPRPEPAQTTSGDSAKSKSKQRFAPVEESEPDETSTDSDSESEVQPNAGRGNPAERPRIVPKSRKPVGGEAAHTSPAPEVVSSFESQDPLAGSEPEVLEDPLRPKSTHGEKVHVEEAEEIPKTFEQAYWQDKIKEAGFQAPPADRSPTRQSASRARKPRKNSSRTQPKKSAVPAGATYIEISDEESDGRPKPFPQVDDYGSAMEIDSPSEQSPAPPATTNRRRSSASQSRSHSRRPSVAQQDAAKTQASPALPPRGNIKKQHTTFSMDALSSVTPIAPMKNGLDGMSDLGSSLPFDSKPSQGTSSPRPEASKSRKLMLPPVPKPPNRPPSLTPESWQRYLSDFVAYMETWHLFNGKVLAHFGQRQTEFRNLSPGWLMNANENATGGLRGYVRGLEDDIKVREFWEKACKTHYNAIMLFEAVRSEVAETFGGHFL